MTGELEKKNKVDPNQSYRRELFLKKVTQEHIQVLESMYRDILEPFRNVFVDGAIRKIEALEMEVCLRKWEQDNPKSILAGEHKKMAAIDYWRACHEEDHCLWYGLIEANKDHFPELVPIRDVVLKWSIDYQLNADWCRHRAIETVSIWAKNNFQVTEPQTELSKLQGNKLDFCGNVTLWMHLHEEKTLEYLPSKDFIKWEWNPFFVKRKPYINKIREEISKRISNDPLLSLADKSHTKPLVDSILAKVKVYCDQVKKHYKSNYAIEATTKQEEEKHIKWAVLSQVKKRTFLEIAENFNTDAANVSRRVNEILTLIGLPKREDIQRGHPKNRKNKPRKHTR